MKNYRRIARAIYSKPWAILPEKLMAIMDFIAWKMRGEAIAPEFEAAIAEQARILEARREAAAQATARSGGMVAVLPIYGVIAHRANMITETSGGTSIEKFTSQFRQVVNDPQVKAIVLDVDSPGGGVDGVDELSSEIFNARTQKRIVALANAWALSAGYYIASAADELIVTPTGEVGSIGVWTAHEDWSKALEAEGVKVTLVSAGKYKTEGNPYEPLGEEAQSAIQNRVNDFYGMFVRAVARNRDVPVAEVRGGFGEGRVVGAKEAVRLGMADRVATLDQTLERFGVSRSMPKAAVAQDPAPDEGTQWRPSLAMRQRQLDLHRHV